MIASGQKWLMKVDFPDPVTPIRAMTTSSGLCDKVSRMKTAMGWGDSFYLIIRSSSKIDSV
jgi:hypothetical protein